MALEDLAGWIARAESAVALAMAQFVQRMGYEPDPQYVSITRQPIDMTDLPDDCRFLFSVIDEISWPDIWNGYFVGPASEVVQAFRDGSPSRIVMDEEERPVVAIGSDGGGAYFVLDSTSLMVLRVSDAVIQYGNLSGNVTLIATSLDAFLEALVENAIAVVNGRAPNF